MRYSKTKFIFAFIYMIIVLYGLSLMSIFIHNRGRKNDEKIEDFGIKLVKKIDTSDEYLLNEFIDYHLDKVFVILSILIGVCSNIFYNKNDKFRFFVEWFLLLTLLCMIKVVGMSLTIYPAPNTETCRVDYRHNDNIKILLDAIKVYVFRNRICYDMFMDTDMINTTLVVLLVMRHMSNWGLGVLMGLLWGLNVFVIMMMRGVYSSNMYTTIMVTLLVYTIFHYESENGRGLFGLMLGKMEKKDDIDLEIIERLPEEEEEKREIELGLESEDEMDVGVM